jgi:predicted  nucleic acid-binding Zn-ribbon protein
MSSAAQAINDNALGEAEQREFAQLDSNIKKLIPRLKNLKYRLDEGDVNIEGFYKELLALLRPFVNFVEEISLEARYQIYSSQTSLSDTSEEVEAELSGIKDAYFGKRIDLKTAEVRCKRVLYSLIRVVEGKAIHFEVE